MKNEIKKIVDHYDRYISNMEENLKKQNLFQEKEIILITDFYEGLKMLIECYNYKYAELGIFGKSKPE